MQETLQARVERQLQRSLWTVYFHLNEESVYCLNIENKFYLLYNMCDSYTTVCSVHSRLTVDVIKERSENNNI